MSVATKDAERLHCRDVLMTETEVMTYSKRGLIVRILYEIIMLQ